MSSPHTNQSSHSISFQIKTIINIIVKCWYWNNFDNNNEKEIPTRGATYNQIKHNLKKILEEVKPHDWGLVYIGSNKNKSVWWGHQNTSKHVKTPTDKGQKVLDVKLEKSSSNLFDEKQQWCENNNDANGCLSNKILGRLLSSPELHWKCVLKKPTLEINFYLWVSSALGPDPNVEC